MVEISEERINRCMDGLMLFLKLLTREGKGFCFPNLPINCFHCLCGDLPAVGGKCQIMNTSSSKCIYRQLLLSMALAEAFYPAPVVHPHQVLWNWKIL